jgi:hypothetical protein
MLKLKPMPNIVKYYLAILFSLLVFICHAQNNTIKDTVSYVMKTYQEKHRAFEHTTDSVYAEISEQFPMFTGKTSEAYWLNKQVKKILNIDSTLSFKQGIQKIHAAYFADYAKTMNSFKDEGNNPSFNYQAFDEVIVAYNKNGYLILYSEVYDYSGGAHGNYGFFSVCLDLKNKKRLELSDLLTADSVTLQRFIEKQFRKDYELKPNEPLTQILFEDKLPANNNFYFDDEGIGFRYTPYEVAPYAAGIIDVKLSYNELIPYLNHSFKQSMNIH